VVLVVQDAANNIVMSATDVITLSLNAGVDGTLTTTAINGIAVFNFLITRTDTYALTADANGLTEAVASVIMLSAALSNMTITFPSNIIIRAHGLPAP